MDKRVVGLLAGSLLLTGYAVWVYTPGSAECIEEPEKKITFIAPLAGSGYWGRAAGGVKDAAADKKISVKYVGFTKSEAQKQAQEIENAVLAGADGIITSAYSNSEEFRNAVAKAEEARIPVIFIDSDEAELKRECYIGSDNYLAGTLAGEELAQMCQETGTIAIISSFEDNANEQLRIAGLQEALEQYPQMEIVKIVEGRGNRLIFNEEIIKLLEQEPDLAGIFCSEGRGSACLCTIIKKNKAVYDNLNIITFDYTETVKEGLEEGIIEATVWQDSYEMGRQAVEALQERFSGAEQTWQVYYTEVKLMGQEDAKYTELIQREDIPWHIY